MLPAFILILDEFPLTHNRKTDKKKLMELPLEQPAPGQAGARRAAVPALAG